MMQLTKETFDILKNFSSINPSISIKAGNKIRTVSPAKNILAEAIVSETFPTDFALYELNQFLGLVSLFDDVNLNFNTTKVDLVEGENSASYYYTDPVTVISPPDKNLELPSQDVCFTLEKETLKKVVNAANQLMLPNIVVSGDGETIRIVACDIKNNSSNQFSKVVGETYTKFKFVYKTPNLKMIENDYDVTISSKGISHFKCENLQYWIATEQESTYG